MFADEAENDDALVWIHRKWIYEPLPVLLELLFLFIFVISYFLTLSEFIINSVLLVVSGILWFSAENDGFLSLEFSGSRALCLPVMLSSDGSACQRSCITPIIM